MYSCLLAASSGAKKFIFLWFPPNMLPTFHTKHDLWWPSVKLIEECGFCTGPVQDVISPRKN